MKYKILRNLGIGLPDHREGEVVTLDEEMATKLILKGLAVPVEIKGVPKPKTEAKPAIGSVETAGKSFESYRSRQTKDTTSDQGD